MDKINKCCIIGELPENLKTDEKEIKRLLRMAILNALTEGYRSFIVPLVKGTGLLAAEVVIEFKTRKQGIELIAVQPYDYFSKSQDWKWNVKHKQVVGKANKLITVSRKSNINCFILTDRWVINNSDKMITIFSGSKETKKSIDYARANGLNLKIIDVK